MNALRHDHVDLSLPLAEIALALQRLMRGEELSGSRMLSAGGGDVVEKCVPCRGTIFGRQAPHLLCQFGSHGIEYLFDI